MNPSSQNSRLYFGLIILLGLFLGYLLYTSKLIPLSALPAEPVLPPDSGIAAKIENLRLNFGVFDNIIFKELRIFGDIPVRPGVTGKADPFSL